MKNWQKIKQQPELLERYVWFEKVVGEVRAYFKSEDFLEVSTPLVVEHPGTEPYLEVFETELQMVPDIRKQAFLITSPEYAMKKLLVAGLPRIFQICKCFRNGEGLSSYHNPEFTMIEWYRAQADYTHIMEDCERLLVWLVEQLHGSAARKNGKLELSYQGRIFDLSNPFPKFSIAEVFERYVGVDADQLLDAAELLKAAQTRGYTVDETTTWEELYNQLFMNEIEPELAKSDRPYFLYDYPLSQAALSKKKASDPRYAERFEWYIGGIELGNAFSELTDAQEQEARLRAELEERKRLGKKEYSLDEDFIEALRAGMPESGGIAVGIDRLVMLLADAKSLDEVVFFPVRDTFRLE